MTVELFFAANVHITLHDMDQFGDWLPVIGRVRLPDKELNIVADLQLRETLYPSHVLGSETEFWTIFYRRNEPDKLLSVQFRDETELVCRRPISSRRTA